MPLATAALFLLVVGLFAAGAPLSAQHATAFDIEDGGRAFRNSCATCHGPDGDQVAGIDLGRGQIRRPYTDEELVGIIRKGIPNTPMPATNMSEVQAVKIVAYLRTTAESRRSASVAGDASRGQSLFERKGECATCHRVNGAGSRLGPDLSRVGQVRRSVELEQSLLDPSAEVLAVNRFYRVVTRGDIGEVASRVAEPAGICNELVDLANFRGGPDNITVVAALFDGAGLAEPADGDAVGHRVLLIDRA